ncbi:DUF742 domain-containing protein [Streptomyces sp. NBC_00859]|uniref:DUF742 domain-containing protein n=1 Tax=Streptomyces sp. NBC_00859 TaxID=2903682 RepID=UPI00386D7A0E|nr:DUF742 domain-containing protein [Streptomyces sp. NBC_00859]
MTGAREGRDQLVRPYVVTGGRSTAGRNAFSEVTLVMLGTDGLSSSSLTPEQTGVLELLRHGALSVAEISGYLGLALSVLRIVLSDLMDSGHIRTRSPIPAARRADRDLLEAVLAGLQNI